MYTDHSYFKAYYGICAGVLKRVIQVIPQDPLEVEIRFKDKYDEPVAIPYSKFDPALLGKFDFLSGAAWGPFKGVRTGLASLRISEDGSHFMTHKSYPKPETCYVGPLNTSFQRDDSAMPYLQVTREGVLEMLLARLILE
jgi:hypothetical protein